MNQAVAEFFLALPSPLTDPVWVGTACLLLCWLGYFAAIRGPLTRAVRQRCSPRILQNTVPRVYQRLLYTALRRKADLDDGFLYLGNLLVFLLLVSVSLVHLPLAIFLKAGETVSSLLLTVDAAFVSLATAVCGILSLGTQPRATWERRERWGFYRQGTVFHIILRELLNLAVMAYWFYDAFFLFATPS